MKMITALILALTLMSMKTVESPNNFHHFETKDIRGNAISLEAYKGNVVMVVNTASQCGFTPQYADLQKLYDKYSDRGFVILGFPANEFGAQEPGSNEEIAQFCERNFGVTFPLFSKTTVKGDGIDPLFKFLTTAANSDFTGDINWNFEKFLIDQDGNLIRRFRSRTNPMDKEILQSIETMLGR